MSDLPFLDYDSLLQEKRAEQRSPLGQVLALAAVFGLLLML